MNPEAELEACRQALRQYRAAWNELRVMLAHKNDPPERPLIVQLSFIAEQMDAIGQKHNLPVES